VTAVGEHVIVLDGASVPSRDVVGNKGLSIARMVGLGLPVPPAFALPIDECRRFHAAGGHLDDDVWQSVVEGVAALEERTSRRLGDPERPLLVSVRSAGAVSMPGMMDTILNLGMTTRSRPVWRSSQAIRASPALRTCASSTSSARRFCGGPRRAT